MVQIHTGDDVLASILLVKHFYVKSSARMRMYREEGRSFNVAVGLRQGV